MRPLIYSEDAFSHPLFLSSCSRKSTPFKQLLVLPIQHTALRASACSALRPAGERRNKSHCCHQGTDLMAALNSLFLIRRLYEDITSTVSFIGVNTWWAAVVSYFTVSPWAQNTSYTPGPACLSARDCVQYRHLSCCINPFTFRTPLEPNVCYSHTSENNFRTKRKLTNYLMESSSLASEKYF